MFLLNNFFRVNMLGTLQNDKEKPLVLIHSFGVTYVLCLQLFIPI